MRRTVLAGFALALSLGVAPALSAQSAQQPAQQEHQRHEHARRGERGQRGPGRGMMRAAFRGIDLSQAQKDQIKAIHERYAPQYKALREQFRPVAQELRAARQKGDTTAARAAFERTKPQREQLRTLSQKELQDVRGVLSADQQKTFDQNLAQLKERMEQRRGEWKQHRGERRGGQRRS